MPCPPLKRIIIIVQSSKTKQNLMAILLVVRPNRTFLDLQNQRLAPALLWNHLADEPTDSPEEKQSLVFSTGFNELCTC